MDKPVLKGVFIMKGIWAVQDGRDVKLIDDNSYPVSVALSGIPAIRYTNFTNRLTDAWREYDATLPPGYVYLNGKFNCPNPECGGKWTHIFDCPFRPLGG